MQKDDIKKDLKKLMDMGIRLGISLSFQVDGDLTSREFPDLSEDDVKRLSDKRFFKNNYDLWYTTSLAVIKQVTPSREKDFVELYKNLNKERKLINATNFVIQDYLDDCRLHPQDRDIYALNKFKQQFEILKTAHNSFDNALFRIESLCYKGVLDSEIHVARALYKTHVEKGINPVVFWRASGAVARVVLEKHLKRICTDKNITPEEKKPTLGAWIACLQKHNIIDDIQRTELTALSEITNYCCHQKEREPTKEEVDKLIDGVESFMKITF
jgi:hypothetical protein